LRLVELYLNFDPAAEKVAILLIPEWARDDATSDVSGMIHRRWDFLNLILKMLNLIQIIIQKAL
jgi:hypothetical protein